MGTRKVLSYKNVTKLKKNFRSCGPPLRHTKSERKLNYPSMFHQRAFTMVDVLILPSAAGPAPATLERTGDAAFNAAWTLTGNPVLSLPLFRAAATGLPIGCQLVGAFAADERLLAAARTIGRLAGP